GFFDAVRPEDVNCIRFRCGAQSEMDARIVAGGVTVGRLHQPPTTPSASLHHNLCPVGVAATESGIDGADAQPVAAWRGHVAIKPRRPANTGDEQVQGPVVIDVAANEASSDEGFTAESGIRCRYLAEVTLAIVS